MSRRPDRKAVYRPKGAQQSRSSRYTDKREGQGWPGRYAKEGREPAGEQEGIRKQENTRGQKDTREQENTRENLRILVSGAALFAVCFALLLTLDPFSKAGNGRAAGARSGRPGAAADTAAERVYHIEYFTEDEKDLPGSEPETEAAFLPRAVKETRPEQFISLTQIEQGGTVLEDEGSFAPWYTMDFQEPGQYTKAEGVITFRGNNFRDSAAWGTAQLAAGELQPIWNVGTGALSYGSAVWTGSGWTGQPLLMKWPESVKEKMNLTDRAKRKEDLVEVIYACMDGYVYFLDLETGEATRDPLYLGFTFKGSGALDPRGYPILYVGAGYDSAKGRARVFIVNLLDCSVMYEFGNNDPFSRRGNLSYFDSSALVDAQSDTLIYPGENGILYLIKLNTSYDKRAGTLSIAPGDITKWNYQGVRTNQASYWVGMETSAAVYRGYLYIADNGGNLMCLDLNTLRLVWVQDTLDDSNSTPVLSWEEGRLYIYVSTSFHYGWRSFTTAPVPIWKIDALTGEVVWRTDYECYTQQGVSGGVQSTVAPGKNALDSYIYVTVSRTGGGELGVLACLDKNTGEIVWEHESTYSWSSPVCVYDEAGNGKVLYCCNSGRMYLLDGLTGETVTSAQLSSGAIEASPAVYDSYVVVGTRASRIWGLKLR